MWNIKIEFDKLEQAGEFINKLRNIKKIEYHIEKQNNQISVNGDNEFSRELVVEILSEIIVTIYKTDYFNRNIKLSFLPQEHKEALIKALVLFDIESDIYYVLTSIERFSNIILSSFNKFLLSKIKHKWHEFVIVANLNGNYLLNYEVFIEFLKFLINSIQPKTSVVNLKSDLSKFLFFDEKNNLMTSRVDLKDEMGLITNLVILAPKNINIHCINQVSNKTFKTLYYLFDKKINLLI